MNIPDLTCIEQVWTILKNRIQSQIFINFEFTLNELKTISNLYLRNPETNFAIDFHNAFVTRFSTKVEMNLPYLAFMFTGYGINSLNYMTQEKIIIQSVSKKNF